jgi:hypothetical protein
MGTPDLDYRHASPTQIAMRALAQLAARARALKLSPERRSEIARHAVNVRWAKHKARQAAEAAMSGSAPTALAALPVAPQGVADHDGPGNGHDETGSN